IPGTFMLKDLTCGAGSSSVAINNPYGFFEYNGYVYFGARDWTNGFELYRTDGTQSGTQLFKEICPANFGGIACSGIDPLNFKPTILNGLMYFGAFTSDIGFELWKTDGTSINTVAIGNVSAG